MIDIEKTIREYIPNVIHMSLATCVDNKPWICEVHYSYDNDLNIYFRSNASRRHSLEIEENPLVSGNIVEQHKVGMKPRGIYFEGEAKMLMDVDKDHQAFLTYNTLFDSGEEILEDARKEDGHKFYIIKVNKFYVFDARESSPSQKYELDW